MKTLPTITVGKMQVEFVRPESDQIRWREIHREGYTSLDEIQVQELLKAIWPLTSKLRIKKPWKLEHIVIHDDDDGRVSWIGAGSPYGHISLKNGKISLKALAEMEDIPSNAFFAVIK